MALVLEAMEAGIEEVRGVCVRATGATMAYQWRG